MNGRPRQQPGRGVAARRAAGRRGRLAEAVCRWHLRLRGWRVLAADWRCPAGEIDIVARRGGVIAVIEVKRRGDWDAALSALRLRQRRRIARAAEAFLIARPDLADLSVRFDVMLIAGASLPRHLPDAWRADR